MNEQADQTLSALNGGGSLDDLIHAVGQDELIAAVRARAEQLNRRMQEDLAPPTPQEETDWTSRKSWILDGQPIYGELKTFYFDALTALNDDDQATYSKTRDLLMKALRTIFGDPPPTQPASVMPSVVIEPAPIDPAA